VFKDSVEACWLSCRAYTVAGVCGAVSIAVGYALALYFERGGLRWRVGGGGEGEGGRRGSGRGEGRGLGC